ncbi:hypothetical protein [Alpinimonas psychrophila]|uniref:Uncharacterized protein n=1 Tax=Alpinimonas psychrophila TaxID=748908 RepID=A0A7W3JUN4_9MICO|nr:hypothetical protein [Alpinimonas psychrophila]MBA8829417.1 hypothetical protein [Alpinimonas psychrophila]
MTESSSPTSYDVLVVGSDVAALMAALDCARIGLRVVLLATPPAEHRPAVFSHRAGIVASLLTELNIPFSIRERVTVKGHESRSTAGAATGSIVGIPANPFALNVREVLGWRGAWRVYLDRLIPLLTIGTETNLGHIVRRRLGKRAERLLVDPVLQALYGLSAEEIPVATVVPGLNQAMTRAGCLTTGIIDLIVADPRVAQVVEVAGGVGHIETVLRERLAFFSARIIDVADVHLTLIEDGENRPTAFGASAFAPSGPITVVTQAALLPAGEALAAQSPANERVAVVGISEQFPGLESAVPESRSASASIRRVLLSDPTRLPLGPLGHEG